MHKTLPEIIFEDPDYFLWGYEKNIFSKSISLQYEADELYDKIRNMKIPENDDNKLVCEFCKNPKTGKLDILQLNNCFDRDKNCVYSNRSIDISLPRNYEINPLENTNVLLPQLFKILFGDANIKPSKNLCIEYFNDESNFFYY